MIIHHNDIVFECCLLLQRTSHGIEDSLLAISHGDNHRGLNGEVLFVEVGILVVVGIHKCSDGIEMACSHLLHLYLHVAVGGIDIVKLLHSACPEVAFLLGV